MSIPKDLRYAFRTLWRDPGFTIPAILALALSIGANTSVFTVVKSVLLEPLRVRRPSELAAVFSMRADGQQWPFNIPNYLDLRERNRVFQDVAASGLWSANLTGEADPQRLLGIRASANFFQVMGVDAALGRALVPEDGLPGSPKVVVFTWDLWQRRYGARRDIVGQPVRLNGEAYVVVGILPRTFAFRNTTAEFAVPLVFETDPLRSLRNSVAFLRVFGRLKPGVSLAQARDDLNGIAAYLRSEYPNAASGIVGIAPVPLQEELTGGSRQLLATLMCAVVFVLLIACANVSSLLVAKSSGRRKELAMRAALGSTRWRAARQFLIESALLSLIGGALGILLAFWGVPLLLAMSPAELPRSAEVRLDSLVLAAALGVSVACGLFLGSIPALQFPRGNLIDALRGAGQAGSTTRSRTRLRGTLIVLEVSLSLVLLTGAGLMLKSFRRLATLDPGFQPGGLLTTRLALPSTRYRTPEAVGVFHQQLRSRIQAIPGVTGVGAISILPLSGPSASSDFTIDGQPPASRKERPTAEYRMIDSTYFRAMRIPIVRGRDFTDQDNAHGRSVVIVSEVLAKLYWKSRDPVGTHIRIEDNTQGARDAEVVGVSAPVRELGLDKPPTPCVFVPLEQVPADLTRFLANSFFWVVRTPLHENLAAQVRREIARVDADVAAADATMDRYMDRALGPQRFSLRILAAFAIAALLLAGSGLYALVGYSTAHRTREIGIRLALGAPRRSVALLVVRQPIGLAMAGVVLGTAAAWASSRYISSLLVEVSPHDTLTLCGAGAFMVALAAVASYIPARRAGKVDPVWSLRSE